MSSHQSNETAIREQAYYFWEQDGRPAGFDNEYWQRAMVAVTEEADAGALTKAAPKRARAAPSAAPKAAAAASRSKDAPSKTGKTAAGKKPKKK
jgi:hypothetical protein